MGLYSVAKLYPPSTSTMKSESELVSNLERMAVRSDNGRLQNSVGVHLRLKLAQDCGLMSSAFTVELVKPHCAFFGGMMISCGSSESCLLTMDMCLSLGAVAHGMNKCCGQRVL